ncbi:C3HC zinc finger-like-domain-containing protein [Fimicolochytrium jonesii]|uniref:C3HC zinc finger-like-domain-containing protein n=1 Tax=Fimicolochytrium jonesii TaxID=1396493 RepID=UPI0022FF19E0|nr:C3HC zinc finger-like-domain-containing protein [Fimicolochytrium jonesii]KAI8819843.1 C3HC zinc finger-like-domain-containing protein [Fimicolochytrium jonesii]
MSASSPRVGTPSKRKLDEILAAFDGNGKGGSQPLLRLKDHQLFQRLHTFREATWFLYGDALTPPMCARFGWTNRGLNGLFCPTCKASIPCEVTDIRSAAKVAEFVGSVHQRLQSAHAESCPWALHALDGEFEIF